MVYAPVGWTEGCCNCDARSAECVWTQQCGIRVGFSEKICDRCRRVVDSKKVAKEMRTDQEIREVFSLAMRDPERSFAEIMEEFRQTLVVGGKSKC